MYELLVDDVEWKARTRYKRKRLQTKAHRNRFIWSGAPNDRFLGNVCSKLSIMPKRFIAMRIIHLYYF